MTPIAEMERSIRLAKCSLGYSSIMFKTLSIFPSLVASKRKIHCPGNVSSYGLMSTHWNPVTCSFVLTFAIRYLETCFSPETMNPFEVHLVPSCKDCPIGLPISLTGVRKCKGAQEFSDLFVNAVFLSYSRRSLSLNGVGL